MTLPATPDLAGTVDFSAYLFGRDARPVGDHRLVFVQPADELKIDAAADAAVYKPGDEARIRFRVTNSKGEGVQAALGCRWWMKPSSPSPKSGPASPRSSFTWNRR